MIDPGLPQRGEFVIRGGHVLTMDTSLGDFPRGYVQVCDGNIVAMGSDLQAPGMEDLDGRDMVVMAGFVDTHWHFRLRRPCG